MKFSSRFQRSVRMVAVAGALAWAAAGCGSLDSGTVITGGQVVNQAPPQAPSLYVADPGAKAILRYDSATSANGNVSPNATVAGAQTTLNNPAGISLDDVDDILVVADSAANAIDFYQSPDTLTGTQNIAPNRQIVGAATNLAGPKFGLIDSTNNRVYVANTAGGNLLRFDAAKTVTGNQAPTQTLTDVQGLTGATGLIMDETSSRDRLYVANPVSKVVAIYSGVGTLSGNVAASPNRVVLTGGGVFVNPTSVSLNLNTQQLFIADPGANKIFRFNNAFSLTTANVNSAPDATINLGGDAANIDSNIQTMYVVSHTSPSVLSFDNSSILTGNPGNAARTINGANTGLVAPISVVVDPIR